MLKRVDRMLLAVRDRQQATLTFEDVLGAKTIQEDELRVYKATRTIVQAGESEFELLEPAGDGPVSAHLESWGEGIFAAGFSTEDPSLVARRMADRGMHFTDEAGQIFIEPDQTRGMRTVVSRPHERPPVGLISYIYEVTNIVDDHEESARFYADAFGLDPSKFAPIKSEQWGYVGTLTLFDPPARLDRIELTQTTEPSLAMGRYYARRGQSIYMCYVETEDTGAVRERLESRGARYTAGRENGGGNLFIHPTALHGMLMGVSRRNLAWTWSGRPELARAGS
jgi:catechol 2,3-dioxygenase-like lactoylglutathione lyase family enzyme